MSNTDKIKNVAEEVLDKAKEKIGQREIDAATDKAYAAVASGETIAKTTADRLQDAYKEKPGLVLTVGIITLAAIAGIIMLVAKRS